MHGAMHGASRGCGGDIGRHTGWRRVSGGRQRTRWRRVSGGRRRAVWQRGPEAHRRTGWQRDPERGARAAVGDGGNHCGGCGRRRPGGVMCRGRWFASGSGVGVREVDLRPWEMWGTGGGRQLCGPVLLFFGSSETPRRAYIGPAVIQIVILTLGLE